MGSTQGQGSGASQKASGELTGHPAEGITSRLETG